MDIYIDGSSFGNPGEAGIGVIFSDGEQPLKNISRYIGKQTNNAAEYTALIFALQEALVMKAKTVHLYTDSELLARQIKGEYKVKNENLKNLFGQAETLMRGFDHFTIRHIPREKNRGADRLARAAIKNKISRTGAGCRPQASCAGEESPSSKELRSG